MARKPIIVLDFDGVLHSYTSGWQGADVISDPPVPGAIDFLRRAVERFEVHIYSSRSGQSGGIAAMKAWLNRAVEDDPVFLGPWLLNIKWPVTKPPAHVTIDDRALTFTGAWPSLEELQSFKPWNKREGAL
jgi:FMN phosphatase YigB (HAD superfamily)